MIGIPAKDIKLSAENECVLTDGDFTLTDTQVVSVGNANYFYNEADERCMYDIIYSTPGAWRNEPTMWVNLLNGVNAPLSPKNRLAIASRIREAILTGGYFSVAAVKIAISGEVDIQSLVRMKK